MNYGGTVGVEAPPGYQFLQLVSQTVDQYSRLLAAFVEVKTFAEAVAAAEQKKKDEIAKYQAQKDKEYTDKITKKLATMQLNQAFSDAITRFNIGDTVFYYSQYPSVDDIEGHIKSFTLSQITYQQESVAMTGENDSVFLQLLKLKGYSGDVVNSTAAFKTKEEAIAGSADEHKKYLDKQAKEMAAQTARKAECDAEILRKAEEIRKRGASA